MSARLKKAKSTKTPNSESTSFSNSRLSGVTCIHCPSVRDRELRARCPGSLRQLGEGNSDATEPRSRRQWLCCEREPGFSEAEFLPGHCRRHIMTNQSWEFRRDRRMKDVYEVLRAKELEMENLRIEIEALRIAAPLLSDDGDDKGAAVVSTRWVAPARPFQVPQAANSDPQPEHAPEWKERTVGFP
jgi:hypothetical protein